VTAFYEMDVGAAVASRPLSPMHQSLGGWVSETFARSGVEPAMGTRLHEVFVAAGLTPMSMFTDALIGGGAEWVERFSSAFGASLLRSMLPWMLRHRVAAEDELALATFDRRYRDEVVSGGGVVRWLPCVGAWARSRPATHTRLTGRQTTVRSNSEETA
jgi:hypothetical protein